MKIFNFTMKNFNGEASVLAKDRESAERRIKREWPLVKIKELKDGGEFKGRKKKK